MLWEKSVSISTVFNATLLDCVNFQIRWINDYMKLYGGQTYFQLLNSSQRVKCLCASAATTSCQGHPITVDLFTKTLSKNQSKKKSIAQNRSCGYFTFGCFKGFWQQTFVCSWSSWWTNLYFLLHSSLTTRSQPCLENFSAVYSTRSCSRISPRQILLHRLDVRLLYLQSMFIILIRHRGIDTAPPAAAGLCCRHINSLAFVHHSWWDLKILTSCQP